MYLFSLYNIISSNKVSHLPYVHAAPSSKDQERFSIVPNLPYYSTLRRNHKKMRKSTNIRSLCDSIIAPAFQERSGTFNPVMFMHQQRLKCACYFVIRYTAHEHAHAHTENTNLILYLNVPTTKVNSRHLASVRESLRN